MAEPKKTRSLVDVLHDALHAGSVEYLITDAEYQAAAAWADATKPIWPTAPVSSSSKETPSG